MTIITMSIAIKRWPSVSVYKAIKWSKFTNFQNYCNKYLVKDCYFDHTSFFYEAAGALKHLSAIIMQAAIFWEQLQDHCQSLAEDKIKSLVEEALKKGSKENYGWNSGHRKGSNSKSYDSMLVGMLCMMYAVLTWSKSS